MAKKIKFKDSIKEIELGFVPSDITFVYGRKNYYKLLKKLRVDVPLDGSGVAISLETNQGHLVLVGMEEIPDTYVEKSIIVHEISHAVSLIMETHGFECDEFRSYLLQHIYLQIMPFYDELKAKS